MLGWFGLGLGGAPRQTAEKIEFRKYDRAKGRAPEISEVESVDALLFRGDVVCAVVAFHVPLQGFRHTYHILPGLECVNPPIPSESNPTSSIVL